MHSASLDYLSPDHLICIFKYLPCNQISSTLIRVCKAWEKLAFNETLWQHFTQEQFPELGNHPPYPSWRKCYFLNLRSKGCIDAKKDNSRIYCAEDKKICFWKHINQNLRWHNAGPAPPPYYDFFSFITDHRLPITDLKIQEMENDEGVITASSDGSIKIFREHITDKDEPTLVHQETLTHHTDAINSLIVAHKWIISASDDSTIGIFKTNFETKKTQLIASVAGHLDAVTGLQQGTTFCEKLGFEFYSASNDQTIRIWQITPDSNCVCLQIIPTAFIHALKIAPSFKYICAKNDKGLLVKWKKRGEGQIILKHVTLLNANDYFPISDREIITGGLGRYKVQVWKKGVLTEAHAKEVAKIKGCTKDICIRGEFIYQLLENQVVNLYSYSPSAHFQHATHLQHFLKLESHS